MKDSIITKFSRQPLERLFLIIGFIFGTSLVFINPPFQANDEDRHFTHAYYISEGTILPEIKDNKIGGPLPKNLVNVIQMFQGIQFSDSMKISYDRMQEAMDKPLNKYDKDFYHNFHYDQNPIKYLPHAIGIAIGRILYSNPVWLDWFGRFTGLIFYLIIVAFAIRITPIFKSVFFLYGLTPMVLYQAASVTYDMMLNSLSFLMLAVYLYYALEKESSLTIKDFILIAALALIHRYTKTGYLLIPFIFFIIPPKKIGNWRKVAVVWPMFGLYFAMLYQFIPAHTWFAIVSGIKIPSSGIPTPVLKKDLVHGWAQNQAYNLAHPYEFAKNIIDNWLFFRQEWITGTIGRFGYAYVMLPKFFIILHGLILISAAFLESRKDIILHVYQKVILGFVGICTILLITIGMYFNSAIGAKMVFGLQGRYFIPIVPIILLLLYNNQFELKAWKKWKNTILASYMTIFLIYLFFFLKDSFYSP